MHPLPPPPPRTPSPARSTRARSPRPRLLIDLEGALAPLAHFSPHPVVFEGKRYPTAYHLLEAFRFMEAHPELAERVRHCGAVDEVRQLVQQSAQFIRPDWENIVVRKVRRASCRVIAWPLT